MQRGRKETRHKIRGEGRKFRRFEKEKRKKERGKEK